MFNLFKSPERVFVDNIIKEEVFRAGYFSRNENKRELNNLVEIKKDDGYDYIYNGKILNLTSTSKKRLRKAINGAFWSIEMHMEYVF